MAKMVDVINGNKGETVDVATVMTTSQEAEQITETVWQEDAVMPDGRRCLKKYEFNGDEIAEAKNCDDPIQYEEFLPWDDEHVFEVTIY